MLTLACKEACTANARVQYNSWCWLALVVIVKRLALQKHRGLKT